MIGILVTATMFILFRGGAFDFLEQKSIDWRFLVRGETAADPGIVIVSIDEASFSELNQKWPWPRTTFARLIDRLAQAGARVIGMDIILSEAFSGDQDRELARSAKRSGNVIFPSKFEETIRRVQWKGRVVELKEEVLKGPIQVISESGDVGYLNLPLDSDSFVRRFTPLRPYQGVMYASFDLKVAARYLGVPLEGLRYVPYEMLGLGDRSIPLNQYNSTHINFAGPSGKFQRIPFYQVLSGQYPPGLFNGKIVLVGAAFLDSKDFFHTPFMEREKGKRYPLFGVEIHANVINTILKERFIRPTSFILDALVIILGGLLLTFLSLRLSPLKAAFWVAITMLAYTGASIGLFSRDILLTTAPPLLTFPAVFLSLVVFRYFTEEREKRRIRGIFQKYVSADVVDRLIQDPKEIKLGGEERELTVLFCDLEGFTTYSEQFSPQEMVALLSEYFTDMTDQIFAHEGTLKEYVGDELMAIFGAPVEQPDHAERACAAALAMKERRRLLREAWADTGRPPLRARTGINSGPMLVGNLGSAHRFSYGVLGDQVNLGSRLEGLNKVYGSEILVGENTARLVTGPFLLREIDWVRVKGKRKPVGVYELVAERGVSLPDETEQAMESYAEGLKAYRQQLWEEALGHFEQALVLCPEDGPSKTMAQRCHDYRKSPPQGEWDGVFQQLTK
jgi:adenylate cyclase